MRLLYMGGSLSDNPTRRANPRPVDNSTAHGRRRAVRGDLETDARLRWLANPGDDEAMVLVEPESEPYMSEC